MAKDTKKLIRGKAFVVGDNVDTDQIIPAEYLVAQAGIRAAVAESYARIFYRNSINGGYLLPLESPQRLIDQIATGDELELDRSINVLRHPASGKSWTLKPLGDVADIIAAGGIFEYAKRTGMLK
jgi:3-isopropylmalate/(R)-2-methylmalate dehydratase small subunit